MEGALRTANKDSVPSEVVFKLGVDHFVHLTRDSTGWTETDERIPWTTDTVFVEAVIQPNSNLYRAMDVAAPQIPREERNRLTYSLADVYDYKVDMSRDLQDGDTFRVMAELQRLQGGSAGGGLGSSGASGGSGGSVVRFGRIVTASAKLSGR